MLHNQHIKYLTDDGSDDYETSVSAGNNGKAKTEELPFLTVPYMSEQKLVNNFLFVLLLLQRYDLMLPIIAAPLYPVTSL